MRGLTKEARRRALKMETGELVKSVGGIEAAADYTGKGKSTVHRYTSVNDDEYFMPVHDVAELEAIAPKPHVTRLLCKLAGGVFMPLPDVVPEAEELPLHVMRVASELGELSDEVTKSLADGKVTRQEADAIERELDDLIDAATHMRAMVKAITGQRVAPDYQQGGKKPPQGGK